MFSHRRLALVSILVPALVACAQTGPLKPFGSSRNEVRLAMGKPTDIRFSRDGEDIWEYITSPMGRQTYIIRFDKDGTVRQVTQALDDQNLRRIRAKQSTKPEVRDLLGMPADVAFFGDDESWEYRTQELDGGTSTFNVRFGKDGVVKEAIRIVDPVGGSRKR